MTKQKKAIVLSSGGCDSTVCVAIAVKELGAKNVSTVSVSYGQKHVKELECAQKVANHYGCDHYTFDLSEIFKSSNCSLLTGSTEDIPEGSYAEQAGRAERQASYRFGNVALCQNRRTNCPRQHLSNERQPNQRENA